MKRILTILTVIMLVSLLCVSVLAEGDFEITDSVIVKYNGSSSVVSIPTDVQGISAGAFDGTGVNLIIFNSFSCGFESGAIPAGVTIKAPESSEAHLAALRDGLSFTALDGSVSITINYQYASGETAHPTFSEEIYSGDSYSYAVPTISGYTPNIASVDGVAGDTDITVTVIYRSTLADGWSVQDGRAKYVKDGNYVVGTTVEIDGLPYTFDQNGYLLIASGFLSTPTGSYYFSNNYAVTGYRVIGKSIYYFNDDGTMIKGTSANGYSFDIGGNLIANDALVHIEGDTYYMVANELCSGYHMVNGNLVCFGKDYRMIKGSSYEGYSFDGNGNLISGISASELEITGLSDVAYTDSAIEPLVTVKFKGITLTRDVHYKLSYSNNVSPGEATLNVSGMGPVSGERSLTFKIIGDEAYTLTIRYVNVMGAPIAESYTTLVEPGEDFDVPSPVIEGYEPDYESVSGTMEHEDITINVTYTKVTETSESESENESESESESLDADESTDEDEETSSGLESDTTDTITDSTSPEESDPEESTAETEKVPTEGYNYDYSLLIKVFIIATVLAGGIIVLILNWDAIKKAIAKKKKGKK